MQHVHQLLEYATPQVSESSLDRKSTCSTAAGAAGAAHFVSTPQGGMPLAAMPGLVQ